MKPFVVIEITLCSALILMCSACTKPAPLEPSSAIVATVENAGAGNLSSLAAPQIEDWLRKHQDLAVQIDDMCKTPRDKADANWPVTTEGRVCIAARNASMYYRQYHNPPKPKGDAVGPGWH